MTSVYSGGDGSPLFIEAAGHYLHPDSPEDVWPRSFHPQLADRLLRISDPDSILAARRLDREEGLLVGGSAGLAVAAGLRVAAELTSEHIVVILLPDSDRSYLSKYHNETWLRHLGFWTRTEAGLSSMPWSVDPPWRKHRRDPSPHRVR